MHCGLFCSKLAIRQPRNGVSDWSILQLLADNWLACGDVASDKNSHASQLTSNNNQAGIACKLKRLRDILQKETTAINFLEGIELKAILPDLKKV